MTADTGTRSTARPETGWAMTRRTRRSGPRTCLPATIVETARRDRTAPDWNIVRGED
ncbi:hypothetical protein WJM95_30305 [Streptomyces sp. f51]|uniref:hypothetical protein n=1 Tax=unclassified Streptomyces TaxID=2593676 RepID=UPI0030CFD48E